MPRKAPVIKDVGVFSYFRAAADWPTWEASLPTSDGFTPALAQGFFSTQRPKIAAKLKSLQSQLVSLVVQWQTDPSATESEKKVAAELTALIQELDRAYVTAVSLMVLSYGESLPYMGFDDWPQNDETNKKSSAFAADPTTFGKCEWTDLDGNPRCNSPWSEDQCSQVAGVFTLGESCPPEPD